MSFEAFGDAQGFFFLAVFGIAVVLGMVVNKTGFCTMGAVSDLVNMGDSGRMRAWLLAIALAMLGVSVFESLDWVRPGDAFPPYRANQLIWAENLLGGLLFGIGMTLASGCGNKNLVRLGAGNLKSLMVLLVIGVIAYFMINPFPGSDQTLMSVLFIPWIRPLAVNLGGPQDLGHLLGGESAESIRLSLGVIIAGTLLVLIFRSREFRRNFDALLGGVIVGLAVLAAWYVSSSVQIDVDGELMSLRDYVQQWDFLADSSAGKPADSRPLAPQSFTFINPLGQSLSYAASGFSSAFLTFGIMAAAGVIVGSLVWALLTRSFRIEWFADLADFRNHLIGAILMGFGGVLALGCTIGQAVTGVSTLAVGSFLTFGAIVLGSALTMKVQYYKLVYEDEASFGKALITGLVDFKLLPERMRKLEAV